MTIDEGIKKEATVMRDHHKPFERMAYDRALYATQEEALSLLGVSATSLSRYVKRGKLGRVKSGLFTYYSRPDIETLLALKESKKWGKGKPPRNCRRVEDGEFRIIS